MTAITPVFATVSTPEIVFDPETLLLDISGSFADSSKDYVSVFITKLGVNEITTAGNVKNKMIEIKPNKTAIKPEIFLLSLNKFWKKFFII
jgi:hypothetical protein